MGLVVQTATKGAGHSGGVRSMLYTLAKLMGDYHAIKKGKVGRRMGRMVAGKAAARALPKLFK